MNLKGELKTVRSQQVARDAQQAALQAEQVRMRALLEQLMGRQIYNVTYYYCSDSNLPLTILPAGVNRRYNYKLWQFL